MRKIVILLISLICFVLFYFTITSAVKVFRTDWELPRTTAQVDTTHRIVLITQELETPFWDQVKASALEQAEKDEVSLEVWGSYGDNQEDFLKKIEIAIFSQVDGIIVQGLDTDEFKNLTKIKAASYGIPIITVANDVPMEESLRRTYVGSDQYMAGKLIAEQLLADMGSSGEVILMSDSQKQYYQKERLEGIKDVLENYPSITTIDAPSYNTDEQVGSTTKDLLNKFPNANGFIAVNANIAGDLIQEIENRSQVEPYHIYSFDEDPELLTLLKQGKLDGMIEQSPKEMGKISVTLIKSWLMNDADLLDLNGYFTDIRVVKAMDVQ